MSKSIKSQLDLEFVYFATFKSSQSKEFQQSILTSI